MKPVHTPPTTSAFGAYMQQLRVQHQWSQQELANRVPMDFTYVYKIEGGHMSPPSDRLLTRLAEVFDVPVEELLRRSNKIPFRLKGMMQEYPFLAELIYRLSVQSFPDTLYQELIARVKSSEEEEQTPFPRRYETILTSTPGERTV